MSVLMLRNEKLYVVPLADISEGSKACRQRCEVPYVESYERSKEFINVPRPLEHRRIINSCIVQIYKHFT